MEQQLPTRRNLCEYSLLEQDIMRLRKQNILNELEILKLTGKSVIFENQEIIACNVVSTFKNRKIINIMVVSKTQSGKTGSMCATIKEYLENSSNLIPIENIYIITGLSSCEWKEQTKERMPESIQSRVYHRAELPSTFANEIKGKKNVLIIMDEIQVAAKKGQTIHATFDKAGILNKHYLYENDVKILEYTATPDGTIYDLMKWGDCASKILAEVGDRYVSAYDLLTQGRVKQYRDLCGYNKKNNSFDEIVYENIREIKGFVDLYEIPRYHIIRTKSSDDQEITIKNFKKIFNIDDYDFIKHDSGTGHDNKDVNTILKVLPTKHTFIFIKEMLRCAKTLKKQHLGVLYDRYVDNPDDATVIQGLIGRDTGYDNNGFSVCFTNIDSIERYEKLWNSNFEDVSIEWNSKTTKRKNGKLTGRNTFNDPKDCDGFSISSDDSHDARVPIIKKFKSQEDAKEYYNTELKEKMKGRGPNKVKPNKEGYYEATIKKIKKVWSINEINNEVYKGAANNDYWFYPCYCDITNKETLEWWFIHY